MAVRDLIGVGLIGLTGYMVYNIMTGKTVINVSPPSGAGKVALDVYDYFTNLGRVESGNRPYVKAPTSSASGLYQFTKGTWESLGGTWGSDLTKPFGGLTPSVEEQQQRAAVLTNQNADFLSKAGVAISNASLYAAHFLGPSVAVKVLAAPRDMLVSALVPAGVITANVFLRGMTVQGFYDWLKGKMGS